jgi:hypothetical protein
MNREERIKKLHKELDSLLNPKNVLLFDGKKYFLWRINTFNKWPLTYSIHQIINKEIEHMRGKTKEQIKNEGVYDTNFDWWVEVEE